MHQLIHYKGGMCRTKCGLPMESFFSCTIWWRDVTCPGCRYVPPPAPPPRSKRRRLVKVADR